MATITINNVPPRMLKTLETISVENNCVIKNTEWQSKYNKYVVYDYEPFCSEGFEIHTKIQGAKIYLNFVKWLYEKRIQQVDFLNSCLEAQYKPSLKRKLLNR